MIVRRDLFINIDHDAIVGFKNMCKIDTLPFVQEQKSWWVGCIQSFIVPFAR